MLKLVSPNNSLGFRTAKTLSDPAVWYAANAFSAKVSVIVAIIMIVLGIVLLRLGKLGKFEPVQVSLLGLSFEIVPLIFLMLLLYLYNLNIRAPKLH